MKTKFNLFILIITISGAFSLSACQDKEKDLVTSNMDFAEQQLKFALEQIDVARSSESVESKENREKKQLGELTNPRTTEPDGSLRLVVSKDWTSGFFPGELWYIYEYTNDDFWKTNAAMQTEILEREKLNGGTHDMGFKMYCSYGNGYRLTHNPVYKDILLESARTLITRFKPQVGCIRSWDHNQDKWQCPVIIDNMLNLELLFWAFKESKDSTFYNIAVSHAKTTMKNHFREDYSCYHVVDYDTLSGEVIKKNTHQGYSHSSAWARGQAWALYGYTMCYRETGIPEFLEMAQHIENYIFTNNNMPVDLIPYWDFNAPDIPDEPRDVSASTVIASALYELSMYVPKNKDHYKGEADRILENLTRSYRAPLNQNNGFLLLHSTGSKPHNSEIDVPLVYADYYFIEALLRKNKLEKTNNIF